MVDFTNIEGRFWRELKAGATQAEAIAHTKIGREIEYAAWHIGRLLPDGAAAEVLLTHLDHAADEAHVLLDYRASSVASAVPGDPTFPAIPLPPTTNTVGVITAPSFQAIPLPAPSPTEAVPVVDAAPAVAPEPVAAEVVPPAVATSEEAVPDPGPPVESAPAATTAEPASDAEPALAEPEVAPAMVADPVAGLETVVAAPSDDGPAPVIAEPAVVETTPADADGLAATVDPPAPAAS